MDALFELLFKYRPMVWERGDLAFTPPPTWLAAAAIVLALAAAATYVRARVRPPGEAVTPAGAPGTKLALAGIRVALLAVLLALLARPVLLIPTIVPQQNYLAVLVDDSRSMRLDDGVAGRHDVRVAGEHERRRGTTVYLPDGRIPLHPPVLSEGAASLLPGEDRQDPRRNIIYGRALRVHRPPGVPVGIDALGPERQQTIGDHVEDRGQQIVDEETQQQRRQGAGFPAGCS